MDTLFVIGNGFDRWHNFPTSYQAFHKFLISSQEYIELRDEFERYFDFKTGEDYLWSDFENDLSTFNYKIFYDDRNDLNPMSEYFKPSCRYSLEDSVCEDSEKFLASIKKAFSEWVLEVDRNYCCQRHSKCSLNEKSLF